MNITLCVNFYIYNSYFGLIVKFNFSIFRNDRLATAINGRLSLAGTWNAILCTQGIKTARDSTGNFQRDILLLPIR